MGYKNHSVEAGVKGEDDCRVAYVKDIHKVKQGFSELTTVNEMGVKKVDNSKQVIKIGSAVLATVAVGIAAFMTWPFVIAAFSTIATAQFVGFGTAATGAFIASKIVSNDVTDKKDSSKDDKE